MKKKVLSIALAALMLTACGEKTNDKEPDKGVQYISGMGIYENGMTFSAGQGDHRVTKFLDFASLETAPLCAVPNCTHSLSSSECLARTSGNSPFLYGDSLYYFRMNGAHGDGDMLETPDGLEFVMESKLMKASLDSSETEEVCVFTDALAREGMYLIIDNILYFIAYDPDPYIDEMGGASWGNAGGYDFLCSINLDTGEYTNYGYFCYVEDEYPAANNSSGANLEGYYNGKIMLQYSFLKKEIVFDEENQPVDNAPFTVYTYEFNPETKEFSKSELPEPCYINEEYYISNIQGSSDITVINGDENYVIQDFYYCDVIANNKVCYNRLDVGGTWCNIDEDKVYIIDGEYKDYYIVAFHDGKYVLFNDRKAVKLSEEELVANSTIYEGEK